MFKPKAYKSMLAASVLTAVMGTGSVFACRGTSWLYSRFK